ncbi:MAG: type 3 dihydrofolate reductase [Betaproteobacteria bacterium]|nr:type 3 dihydrofolate reductase [Betaproteobacteria bacterium]
MRVNLIVAMAKNRAIGINNKMPWHLPADFAWFKKHTLGHPIIMGRKTFESIGKPLPGRRNIVVSRNKEWRAEGCDVFSSLDAALASCTSAEQVFVIGGATLYNEALPVADRLYITEVDVTTEGDTYFPVLESGAWQECWREHRASDEKNAYAMEWVILDRVRSGH